MSGEAVTRILVDAGLDAGLDAVNDAERAGAGTPAGSAKTPGLFRRWAAAELVAEADQPLGWRARGLLCSPTYGMLGGPGKVLKTTLACFAYVGLASGRPVFGRFLVDEPTPVVAYVGEGGRQPYGRLLARVARAMGVDVADLPIVGSHDVAPIGSERFRASLERDLAEVRPGLVGIDPLYAFHGGATSGASLYEEGAMLAELASVCVDGGADLLINSHFNQTGTGTGLRRITMAGGAEWADSWLLLDHRDAPDVEAGRFRLRLDVGSRQWGGTSWDLDFDLGRFDADVGHHVGDITWDLRQASGSQEVALVDRVVELVRAEPRKRTREELAGSLGVRITDARRAVDAAEREGLVVRNEIPASVSGRGRRESLYEPAASPSGRADGRDGEGSEEAE